MTGKSLTSSAPGKGKAVPTSLGDRQQALALARGSMVPASARANCFCQAHTHAGHTRSALGFSCFYLIFSNFYFLIIFYFSFSCSFLFLLCKYSLYMHRPYFSNLACSRCIHGVALFIISTGAKLQGLGVLADVQSRQQLENTRLTRKTKTK